MNAETIVNLYIINATSKSDLRNMGDKQRRMIEERRLMAVRSMLGAKLAHITVNGQWREAIAVVGITHRESAEKWYDLTTTFGDFDPNRMMFEKVEIEV